MSNTALAKYHQNKLLMDKAELIAYCSIGGDCFDSLIASLKGKSKIGIFTRFFSRSGLRLVF